MQISLLRKVFTQYYYLIYKWLPLPSTVFHLLQNLEKVTCKTLSKQLLFFLFHVLKQVFCFFFLTKQLKKNKNWETENIRIFFFYFHSRSPLFSASKQENINRKKKKKKLTTHDLKKKAQIWKKTRRTYVFFTTFLFCKQ